VSANTVRALYVALLGLHPCSFRQSFGDEMLFAFDDAVEEFGSFWLLKDAAFSLIRQRFFRRSEERPNALCSCGFMSGAYPLVGSSELTAGKFFLGFLLSLILFMTIRPIQ
jgi:hypothetical protein